MDGDEPPLDAAAPWGASQSQPTLLLLKPQRSIVDPSSRVATSCIDDALTLTSTKCRTDSAFRDCGSCDLIL